MRVRGDLSRVLLDVGERLGYKALEDWYRISLEDILKNGGKTLLRRSVPVMLQTMFPSHRWELTKFANIPRDSWEVPQNRRDFMDQLGKQLGFKGLEDWYHVRALDVQTRRGGDRLLRFFDGSPAKLVQSVYSEHLWETWRFDRLPRGTWATGDVVDWVKYLGFKLKIRTLDEWYRVSLEQVQQASQAVPMFPLAQVLPQVFPEHPWDLEKFALRGTKKASQRVLAVTLQELFPSSEVLENFQHPELRNESNKSMELDFFLPSERLAFEYQGEVHFQDIYALGSLWKQKQVDSEKRNLCVEKGVTLVEVPYWWDRKKESLAATIRKERSDLLQVNTLVENG